MEQKSTRLKELKKRKLFLILPVLALPFITFIFWNLGGGSVQIDQAEKKGKGVNSRLPVPTFKGDERLDKMSYYEQAASDSITVLEEIKKDPNYRMPDSVQHTDSYLERSLSNLQYSETSKSVLHGISNRDPRADKIYEKIRSLQKVIEEPASTHIAEQDMSEFEYGNAMRSDSGDMKRLEQMMSAMATSQEPDPELQQLGGMLENILDIQHPERVQEKMNQSAINKKSNAYSVDIRKKDDNLSLLHRDEVNRNKGAHQNSFFSISEESPAEELQNSIEAVVHETQTLVSGSVVKLRLTSDVLINGISIMKNSFVFGTASMKGERLEIKISNIRHKNSILPVDLRVYDLDGIAGIFIPGTINRDTAKSSADRSLQSVGLSGLDDSWGAQAAGMGVEAAKSLLSKKVKLIKVVVKAGYKVLLSDEKQSSKL